MGLCLSFSFLLCLGDPCIELPLINVHIFILNYHPSIDVEWALKGNGGKFDYINQYDSNEYDHVWIKSVLTCMITFNK